MFWPLRFQIIFSLQGGKKTSWFVGAMTDWDSRELVIDCSFLPSGSYSAEIMQDGVNAGGNGNDYK